MILKDAYAEGKERLRNAGVPEADLDAWLLLEHVTGISRTVYYADPDREIPEEKYGQYKKYLEQREAHIPLQHITGEQDFMGLTFQVNEHVLIPRQDTETLVEEALKKLEGFRAEDAGQIRILDLCTGSGCILLSVLHYAGRPLEGTGSDISEKALETARGNAVSLGIRAEFIRGDLFENVDGRFHMILSNPPYIRTGEIETLQDEVKLHDPRLALDGMEDGLHFYRRIITESREYLLPGGWMIFEIGYDQAEDVRGLMAGAGYTDITVKKDLAGLDRVVCGRYIK